MAVNVMHGRCLHVLPILHLLHAVALQRLQSARKRPTTRPVKHLRAIRSVEIAKRKQLSHKVDAQPAILHPRHANRVLHPQVGKLPHP